MVTVLSRTPKGAHPRVAPRLGYWLSPIGYAVTLPVQGSRFRVHGSGFRVQVSLRPLLPPPVPRRFVIRHSSFVIRHSGPLPPPPVPRRFVIRHSSFVIRHSGPLPPPLAPRPSANPPRISLPSPACRGHNPLQTHVRMVGIAMSFFARTAVSTAARAHPAALTASATPVAFLPPNHLHRPHHGSTALHVLTDTNHSKAGADRVLARSALSAEFSAHSRPVNISIRARVGERQTIKQKPSKLTIFTIDKLQGKRKIVAIEWPAIRK